MACTDFKYEFNSGIIRVWYIIYYTFQTLYLQRYTIKTIPYNVAVKVYCKTTPLLILHISLRPHPTFKGTFSTIQLTYVPSITLAIQIDHKTFPYTAAVNVY